MDQMQTPQPMTTAAPVKAEPGLSFKGLVRVFTSPTKFFEQLKDNPKVLVPVLAMWILALIAMALLIDQIASLSLQAQADSLRARGLTDAQIQQFANSPWTRIGPMVMSVFVMLAPFITGAFALMFGNFAMGGKAKYMQLVSVMAYAEVLYFATSLINVPFQMVKESLTPPFSLAVLFPNLTFQDPLLVALAKVSPMYIWEVIVAGIGLSIVYKFSRNKGYVLAVLSLGLLSVLHVGSAMLGKMFQ